LSIVEDGDAVTTIRERLEEHRDNPSCQGCHGVIDPPGLALENFTRSEDLSHCIRGSHTAPVLSAGPGGPGPVLTVTEMGEEDPPAQPFDMPALGG
jgi:hypothetical protein